VNHLRAAAAPPPQELLAWCRLSVVAELLSTTPRTIESIALQLDFPSDTALRNMMKRYTGLRATDVRTRGGIRCVMDALAIDLVTRSSKQLAIA
jgi:transcriptional regulator GlxA family with amidase domain